MRRHHRALKANFNPAQPRVPAGNTAGGQWTSGGRAGVGEVTEFSGARKIPPVVREFGKWTTRQFISRYCKAEVNRELPGEFEDMTIADVWNLARGGDARARTCMKLIQPRFKK